MAKRETLYCEQGSLEWHEARLSIVTASNFSKVLAKGEGKTRKDYMRVLLGERGTGEPDVGYNDKNMENGKEREPLAIAAYEAEVGVTVDRVGFVRWGGVGASPDGLVGTDGCIEAKCPMAKTHVGYCLGEITIPYFTQIQGVMWVADRKWCDFISYHPAYDPQKLFIKRYEADLEFFEKLKQGTADFIAEMEYKESQLNKPF